MRLEQVMTRNVEVIRPDATIEEAAQWMREFDIGILPVRDGDHLLGTLTDRDITVRATAAGLDPRTTPVYDVMTPDVVYGYIDQDVEEAARMMENAQVRRLLVLDRDRRLAGIVSLDDLAARAGAATLSGAVLKTVSAATSLGQ